jgi:hypothetical protein
MPTPFGDSKKILRWLAMSSMHSFFRKSELASRNRKEKGIGAIKSCFINIVSGISFYSFLGAAL